MAVNHQIIAYGLLESWDIATEDKFSEENSSSWELFLTVDAYLNELQEEETIREELSRVHALLGLQ